MLSATLREINSTNSGGIRSLIRIAVDGYSRIATSFIDCVAWNKAAELLAVRTEGKQISITGRLQTRIWEKDDIERKATEVIIRSVQL